MYLVLSALTSSPISLAAATKASAFSFTVCYRYYWNNINHNNNNNNNVLNIEKKASGLYDEHGC